MIAMTWLHFWEYVNLGGFIAAAIVNFRAARRSFLEVRVRLYVTSFLAVMYSIAYTVLIFGDVDSGDWGDNIRGFSIITLVVVWIWPALTVKRVSLEADRRLRSREGYTDDDPG